MSSFPALCVVEQSPLACEETGAAGELRMVHTVVKNVPFDIRLGVEASPYGEDSVMDFNHFPFDAKLCYDTPERKEVHFVTSRPFEVRRVLQSSGTFVHLQFRIKALSSHYENLCFLLCIFAVDPLHHGTPLDPNLAATSAPIRVISKLETNKKRKEPTGRQPVPRKKKEDRIKDAIEEIHHTVIQQDQIVRGLSQWAAEQGFHTPPSHLLRSSSPPSPPPALPTSFTTPSPTHPTLSPLFRTEPSQPGIPLFDLQSESPNTNANVAFEWPAELALPETSMEDVFSESHFRFAFESFMTVNQTLEQDERHDRIRTILRKLSRDQADVLSQFLKVLLSHGVEACSRQVGCSCSYCPYELQVQQFQLEQLTATLDPDSAFSFYPE